MVVALISAVPGERRVALVEEGRLCDYRVVRDTAPHMLGDLYVGRVTRLDRGRKAAFVELGSGKPAFLPVSRAGHDDLGEGAHLLVRVVREALAEKGPVIAGVPGEPPPGKGPRLVARAGDPVETLLTAGKDVESVVVDDFSYFQELRGQLAALAPPLVERAHLHTARESLFGAYGIAGEVEDLLLPDVPLPSGGRLRIEPVATLTAIDVDSGRHRGETAPRRLAREVNLEAVPAIARQLRLRGLGGLIVVDFLEPGGAEAGQEVARAMRKACRRDPEPVQVAPMRRSGLLEMTRRRARPALHEVLTEACGLGGGGRRKTAATLAFEAVREVKAQLARTPGRRCTLRAAPRVKSALEGEAAPALRGLMEDFAVGLEVVSDPAIEEFEAVTR